MCVYVFLCRSSQKEQRSRESKESADASGESDGPSGHDLRHTIQRLRSEARGHRQVISQLKAQLQHTSAQSPGACGVGAGFDPELIVGMARELERLKEENEASQRRARCLEGRLQQEREEKDGRMREKERERQEMEAKRAGGSEGGGQGETVRKERERKKDRRERGEREEMGANSRDDESGSSKSSSPYRKTVDLMARHTVRVLPIGLLTDT